MLFTGGLSYIVHHHNTHDMTPTHIDASGRCNGQSLKLALVDTGGGGQCREAVYDSMEQLIAELCTQFSVFYRQTNAGIT